MNEMLMTSMLNLIKDGKNPEQLMIAYLKGLNTPMGDSLANMMQNNDQKGLENFARNICAQNGLDFDKEFNSFKRNAKL